MKDDMKLLLEMQTKDLRILDIKKTQKEEPARIEQMKELYNEKMEEVKVFKQKKKDSIISKEGLENEVAANEEKTKKLQLQLYQVKTNNEYRALEKEIESAKKEKSRLEDRVLESMEKIDKSQEAIEAAEKEAEDAKDKLNQEKIKVEQELKRMEEEKVLLEKEKKEISEKIDRKSVKIYEQIFKNKQGLTMVTIKNNVCGGCHLGLPPNVLNDVMKNNKIILCDNCNRILYHLR